MMPADKPIVASVAGSHKMAVNPQKFNLLANGGRLSTNLDLEAQDILLERLNLPPERDVILKLVSDTQALVGGEHGSHPVKLPPKSSVALH